MINAIINGLLSIISALLQLILAPIDLIINAIFPDVGSAQQAFDAGYSYVAKAVGWVFDLYPGNPDLLILLALLGVAYLNSGLTYTLLRGAWEWFQKVKFW